MDYGFSTEGFFDPRRGPEPLLPEQLHVVVVTCGNPECIDGRREPDPTDPGEVNVCPACEGYAVQLDVGRGQEALVLLMAAMQMYGSAPEYGESDIVYDDVVERVANLMEQVTPARLGPKDPDPVGGPKPATPGQRLQLFKYGEDPEFHATNSSARAGACTWHGPKVCSDPARWSFEWLKEPATGRTVKEAACDRGLESALLAGYLVGQYTQRTSPRSSSGSPP